MVTYRDQLQDFVGWPEEAQSAGPRNLGILLVLITAPLALTFYIVTSFDIHWTLPFRDVAAVARVHPLNGAISTLGLLLWSAAAAVWLCTAWLARVAGLAHVGSFAGAGLLTLYLEIDDAFLLHEALLPALLEATERGPLLAIATVGLIYGFFARRMLLRTPVIYLLCLSMLPVSIMLDNTSMIHVLPHGNFRLVAEDVAKWIGIVGWLMTALWHFGQTANHLPNASRKR